MVVCLFADCNYGSDGETVFTFADAVIVGFDVTDCTSFHNAITIIEIVLEWKKTPIIVAVGNKIDRPDRCIATFEAESTFSSMVPPIPYYETSMKTGENVKHVVGDVVRMWLSASGQGMKDNDNAEHPKKCIIN